MHFTGTMPHYLTKQNVQMIMPSTQWILFKVGRKSNLFGAFSTLSMGDSANLGDKNLKIQILADSMGVMLTQ